jgi:hypothetical protein
MPSPRHKLLVKSPLQKNSVQTELTRPRPWRAAAPLLTKSPTERIPGGIGVYGLEVFKPQAIAALPVEVTVNFTIPAPSPLAN